MKKIVFLLALVSQISFAQSTLFDKLEDMDEVATVVVTQDAFELLRKFPNSNSEELEVFNAAKGLKVLKVFSTGEPKTAVKMESMVKNAIRKSNLTELMRYKEKNSRAKIYVKTTKNKDIVSEVLMFVRGSDVDLGQTKTKYNTIIVSLVGEIDINKLSKIANQYTKKKAN